MLQGSYIKQTPRSLSSIRAQSGQKVQVLHTKNGFGHYESDRDSWEWENRPQGSRHTQTRTEGDFGQSHRGSAESDRL